MADEFGFHGSRNGDDDRDVQQTIDDSRFIPEGEPLAGILIRFATAYPGASCGVWSTALIYAVGAIPAAMACRAAMWIFMAADPAGVAVSQVRGRLPTYPLRTTR